MTNEASPKESQMLSVPDNDIHVIAYRLSHVERAVHDVGAKLDNYTALFVTIQTLELHLRPILTDIIELQGKDREREKERNSFRAQLSLAILVCIASPIFTIVINVIMNGNSK